MWPGPVLAQLAHIPLDWKLSSLRDLVRWQLVPQSLGEVLSSLLQNILLASAVGSVLSDQQPGLHLQDTAGLFWYLSP